MNLLKNNQRFTNFICYHGLLRGLISTPLLQILVLITLDSIKSVRATTLILLETPHSSHDNGTYSKYHIKPFSPQAYLNHHHLFRLLPEMESPRSIIVWWLTYTCRLKTSALHSTSNCNYTKNATKQPHLVNPKKIRTLVTKDN